MLKKFKKNKPKKSRNKPDEIFQHSGLVMARFGRHVVSKNIRTAQQQQELKKRAIVEFPKICKEIDNRVLKIQKLVKEFNPLRLMQCSFFNNFHSMLGKSSESEYDFEDIASQRMLDYIQSIIVSTPGIEVNKDNFDEAQWNKLYEEVKSLYILLTPSFQIARSLYLEATQKDIDKEYDKFYVQAEMIWLNVRGDRYFVHDMTHLESLLSPHNEIFKSLFNLSVNGFLEGIRNIQDSLSKGLGLVTEELHCFHQRFMNEMKINNITFKDCENPDNFSAMLKKMGWENQWASICGRFHYFDLFDLQKTTNFPESLLGELSWKPGENKDFFNAGDYAGWPLKLLPVQIRPFLCIDDKYYCFDLTNLMDHLYRIVQRLVIRLEPNYKETWNTIQKITTEKIPFKIFEQLLPRGGQYKSIYYRGNVGNLSQRDWCETDGIIVYDDQLFIIEVKAGAFSYKPPTTDFHTYIESTKELIAKPVDQAKRFIDYLESDKEVIIYDAEHKPIRTLSKKQFRNITACCVTLDCFTELAARSHKLHQIGVELSIPAWTISIDDLRVYADILDNPVIFTHFLEQRQKAAKDKNFEVNDELDHLGLYLEHNHYTNYAKKLSKGIKTGYVNWYGYRKSIDYYYHQLFTDPCNAKKPLQKKLNGYFLDIIQLLGTCKTTGRCKAGSYLLNLSGEARTNINKMICNALSKQSLRHRIMPISFIGEVKITIFCYSKNIVPTSDEWACDYTYARAHIAKDNSRMMLQTYFDENNNLINVRYRFLSLNELSPSKINVIKALAKNMSEEAIYREREKGKIGRNVPCPCGSGKKFKHCCGNL